MGYFVQSKKFHENFFTIIWKYKVWKFVESTSSVRNLTKNNDYQTFSKQNRIILSIISNGHFITVF